MDVVEQHPRLATTRAVVMLGLVAALTVAASWIATGGAAVADAAAPPDKRVMLVSDSVGLGVRNSLHEHFPADWDVTVTGTKSVSIGQLERDFVRPNIERLGSHVVVAGGYNFPYRDGLAASIDSMIDTLTDAGVEHVYWVTLREVREEIVSPSAWRRIEPFHWHFPVVNAELERALMRHPELTLVDWAAAADRPGLTTDAIHLNGDGRDLYGSLIRRAVGDTTLRPANGGVTRVNVATPEEVAAGDVVAVAVNLTSVRARATGFLTAFACDDERQTTSNLNHGRDPAVAAAAIVRVGESGDVCVYNQQAGHVIVDVFGRFGASADLLEADAERALDTRATWPLLADSQRRVVVDPPASGDARGGRTVVLNVTAVQPREKGYVTVHDCDSGPGATSNVNFERRRTTPNLVVVGTDSAGGVCVTTSAITHVLVDRLAVFGADSTVTAGDASRLLDTRTTDAATGTRTVSVQLPDSAGAASDGGVIANVTIVGASAPGHATAYPCAAERPDTSNVNFGTGSAVANTVAVEPDADGRICVYTSTNADVLFDLLATTGAGFAGIVPTRASDSRV